MNTHTEPTLEQRVLAIMLFSGYVQVINLPELKVWEHPEHGKLSDSGIMKITKYHTSFDWLIPVAEKIAQKYEVSLLLCGTHTESSIGNSLDHKIKTGRTNKSSIQCLFEVVSNTCITWCETNNISLD